MKQAFLILSIFIYSSFSNAAIITFSEKLTFINATENDQLIETFETIPTYPSVNPSITNNGITYTGLATSNNVTVVKHDGTYSFDTIKTFTNVLTGNGQDNVQIDFSLATQSLAVGFDTYLNQYTVDVGGATLDVFGISGLLGSFTHNHDAANVGFVGILAEEDITRIVWKTTNGNIVNTAIDNVIIADAKVPEPSILALLGLGLAGIGFARRRRRA